MLTQQDIYAAGSETHHPMLNKENYVPWLSRLLCYAKSRPNEKLIYNSIINGLYVRRMILEPGDQNHEVPVNETFHLLIPRKEEARIQLQAEEFDLMDAVGDLDEIEKVAGFEEALKRERSRIGRNIEGNKPSEAKAKENGRREINLPSLLAADLGRNEDGQPLRYSLMSVHGGRQSSIYIGRNLPPNSMRVSLMDKPQVFYSQLRLVIPPLGSLYLPFTNKERSPNLPERSNKVCDPLCLLDQGISAPRWTENAFPYSKRSLQKCTWHFTTSNKEKARVSELSPLDLLSTYKGLMEKTYTWIEAREFATNGALNDQRDNFKRSRKSSWDNSRGKRSRDRKGSQKLRATSSYVGKQTIARHVQVLQFSRRPWTGH
nr:ribonuclease H-like domain-containing protein [Tanacetum cinerariifolium]